MVDGRLKIAIVETDERLPRADIVVVRHQDLRDEAGDMRRYGRNIAPGIGVVGAFDEAADAPPLIAVARGGERKEASKAGIEQPLEPSLGERAALRRLEWRLPR